MSMFLNSKWPTWFNVTVKQGSLSLDAFAISLFFLTYKFHSPMYLLCFLCPCLFVELIT